MPFLKKILGWIFALLFVLFLLSIGGWVWLWIYVPELAQ